jgi:hypothetical protein
MNNDTGPRRTQEQVLRERQALGMKMDLAGSVLEQYESRMACRVREIRITLKEGGSQGCVVMVKLTDALGKPHVGFAGGADVGDALLNTIDKLARREMKFKEDIPYHEWLERQRRTGEGGA